MRKLMLAAGLAAALGLGAPKAAAQSDPQGTITYALPQTVLSLKVEVRRIDFHAGPYARYAEKYLGVQAASEDKVSYEISSVSLTPLTEADPSARRTLTPGKGLPAFLALSAQGLVSVGEGAGQDLSWSFGSSAGGDFSQKGLSSNLTTESATLYGADRMAVRQDMVVQKSTEQRAREAAEMILNLRSKRIQIATGDTDATFSGEAMGAALAEVSRLEKEYLEMFLGYSDISLQTRTFDIIPSKSEARQAYIAFRLSEAAGLASAGETVGKPYMLRLEPGTVSIPEGSASPGKGSFAAIRIPAICDVTLTDGANVLLQGRIPVYQLGAESWFPITY